MGSCPNSDLVPGAVQQRATLLDKSVDAYHDIALRPCYGYFEHSEPNPPTLYTAHLDSHRATNDPIFLPADEKTTSFRTGIKDSFRISCDYRGDLQGSESTGQCIDRGLFSYSCPDNQTSRFMNRPG